MASTGVNRQPTGVRQRCRTVGGAATALAGAAATTDNHFGSRLCRSNAQVGPKANGATACLTRARRSMLELRAGKLARAVLRGLGSREAPRLPDLGWRHLGRRSLVPNGLQLLTSAGVSGQRPPGSHGPPGGVGLERRCLPSAQPAAAPPPSPRASVTVPGQPASAAPSRRPLRPDWPGPPAAPRPAVTVSAPSLRRGQVQRRW